MTNYLVNFADARFRESQQLANMFAELHGLDLTYSYSDERFHEEFASYVKKHDKIFSQQRGHGYWLWKPFLISHVLNKIADNDILLYSDTGLIFFRSPAPLFHLLSNHEQLFFSLPGCLNKEWAKRDLFIALECDDVTHWNRLQTGAQCSVWRATPQSRARAQEWLNWCENYELLSDHPSSAPNLPEFVDHRHDQSILSLLTARWNAEIFRNPNQHGNDHPQENSPYETLAFAIGPIRENTLFPEIWRQVLEPALQDLMKGN